MRPPSVPALIRRVLADDQIDHGQFHQRYWSYLMVRSMWRLASVFDRLVFPSHLRRPIKGPVFLLGAPRSGTTLLYHLMSRHPRLVAPKTYETVFPTILGLRAIRALGRLDDRRGQTMRKKLDAALDYDRQIYAGMHELAWDEPEEDEQLFIYAMRSPSVTRFFPFVEELERAAWLDEHGPGERRSVMAMYQGAIRRILHARGAGPEAVYFCKNVYAAGRLESLRQTFPDAQWVQIIRDPEKVLPSAVRLVCAQPCSVLHDPERRRAMADAAARMVLGLFQRLMAFERTVSAASLHQIRMPDLLANPQAEVEGLFERLGLGVDDQARRGLEQEVAKMARHRSPAKGGWAELAIDRAPYADELKVISRHYGFEG